MILRNISKLQWLFFLFLFEFSLGLSQPMIYGMKPYGNMPYQLI